MALTALKKVPYVNCNLSKVEIPASVSYVEGLAFSYNPELTTITVDPANAHYSSIDNMLTNKQQDTLYFCPMTKEGVLRLPKSLRSVGDAAFKGCKKLNTIILNEGLLSVGHYAFQECTLLDSIYVPMSIESWGMYTMYDTKWEKDHAVGLQYLGPVAIGNKFYPYMQSVSSLNIKEGTTCIADFSFAYYDNLTHVKLPKGLKYIGMEALSHNYNLTSLRIPESVKHIGYGAFSCNRKLSFINIPEGVITLGEGVFSLTGNLQEIYYYRKTKYWPYFNSGGDNYCTFHVPQEVFELFEQDFLRENYPKGYFPNYLEPMGPLGDINEDFHLDIGDANQMVNMMLGKTEGNWFLSDFDGDLSVDVNDLNDLINLMMNKE